MKEKLYRTFVAVSLTVDEVLKFISDFSKLECTTWTKTCVTFGETSPRLCTVAVHVELDKEFLLVPSFKDGMLQHYGWSNKFVLLPETTTAKEIGVEFNEPLIPDKKRLRELRQPQFPGPTVAMTPTAPEYNILGPGH